MLPTDRRRRLALAFQRSKDFLSEKHDAQSVRKLEDIMYASIRTLGFIWESQADESLERVIELIIREMADVVAQSIGVSRDAVYMDIVR